MSVHHDFFCYPDLDPRFLKWIQIKIRNTDTPRIILQMRGEGGIFELHIIIYISWYLILFLVLTI